MTMTVSARSQFGVPSRSTIVALITLLATTTSLASACENITWVDCMTQIPLPIQQQLAQIPPDQAVPEIPSTLKCGQLVVPMDYSKGISEENNITLGFAMYRPENPKGLLNYQPGGPNLEVASNAWNMALNMSATNGFFNFKDYDFLAMDLRGTYSSTPLNCSLANYTLPSGLPSNEQEFTDYQVAIGEYAQTCIDNSAPGLLQFTGTKETVQDWDNLRQALGYDKMHWLGWSYGTYGGAQYANTFPEHVDKFVLDGVHAHGMPNKELGQSQIRAINDLLERSDAYCLTDKECPFHDKGKGSVIDAYASALNMTFSGQSQNVSTDDMQAMTYMAYLGSESNFPGLNGALALALQGNWTGFDYISFEPLFTPQFFPVLPTICLDQRGVSFDEFDALRQATAEVDTNKMEFSLDLTLIALCSGWPYHAASEPEMVVDAQMLLVTSDFDANTPSEETFFQMKQSPNSTLVIRHGDDHGSYFLPGPVRDVMADFIVNGTKPSATNQSAFSVYPPSEFRANGPPAIVDPYKAPYQPIPTNGP